MQAAFPVILLALMLGLILPFFFPDPRWGIGLVIAAAIAAGAVRVWLIPRVCPRRLSRSAAAFAMGAAVSTAHGIDWWFGQLPETCWRDAHEVTVKVVTFPRVDQLPDGTPRQWFEGALLASARKECHVRGTLGMAFYQGEPSLQLGDVLQAGVRLRPPSTQLSAGAFPDQARNLARDRRANGTVIQLLARKAATTGLQAWRRRLAHALDTAIPDERQAALLRALVVGDAAGISTEDWQRFRHLGLAHVLVISGLHIGLVAAFAWGIAGLPRRFHRFRGDRGGEGIRMMVTLFAALAYAALAGLTVPTQRALIMLGVVLGIRALGWQVAPLNALGLAVAIILLWDPPALLASSLWMSAGATGVLLLLVDRSPDERPWLFRAVALQLRLIIYLLPLGWFWFGEASVAGVFTNLVIVPVLTFWTVPLALVGAASETLVTGTGLVGWRLSSLPLPLLLNVLDWLAIRAGSLMLEVQASASLATGLGVLALALLTKRRGLGVLGSLVTAFALWPLNPKTELVVLDVGQGTAVVFNHRGRILLYDTGGGSPSGFTQADKIIVPWLRHHGISQIDTLVTSHQDHDHSAGIEVLMQAFPVTRQWGFQGLPCTEGKVWHWAPGITFQFLNGEGQDLESSNANSCVLLIEANGTRIILAGDIGLRRERQLVRYWWERLKADLLLVAHHGSSTSTGYSWLKWVDPGQAILSRARGNRFGHPAPEVVARLNALNIDIVDTAKSGTVRWELSRDGRVQRTASRNLWSPWWLRLP
jgi:competence protein ComEC